MKLSIEGTPVEIKNALQAIYGSEERMANASELAARIENELLRLK